MPLTHPCLDPQPLKNSTCTSTSHTNVHNTLLTLVWTKHAHKSQLGVHVWHYSNSIYTNVSNISKDGSVWMHATPNIKWSLPVANIKLQCQWYLLTARNKGISALTECICIAGSELSTGSPQSWFPSPAMLASACLSSQQLPAQSPDSTHSGQQLSCVLHLQLFLLVPFSILPYL